MQFVEFVVTNPLRKVGFGGAVDLTEIGGGCMVLCFDFLFLFMRCGGMRGEVVGAGCPVGWDPSL